MLIAKVGSTTTFEGLLADMPALFRGVRHCAEPEFGHEAGQSGEYECCGQRGPDLGRSQL